MNKFNSLVVILLGIALFSPSRFVLADFQHEAGLFVYQADDSDGNKTVGASLY